MMYIQLLVIYRRGGWMRSLAGLQRWQANVFPGGMLKFCSALIIAHKRACFSERFEISRVYGDQHKKKSMEMTLRENHVEVSQTIFWPQYCRTNGNEVCWALSTELLSTLQPPEIIQLSRMTLHLTINGSVPPPTSSNTGFNTMPLKRASWISQRAFHAKFQNHIHYARIGLCKSTLLSQPNHPWRRKIFIYKHTIYITVFTMPSSKHWNVTFLIHIMHYTLH